MAGGGGGGGGGGAEREIHKEREAMIERDGGVAGKGV